MLKMEGDLSQAMERYTAGLGLLVPLLQSEPKGRRSELTAAASSVADPDPFDFGPPESGSISQRYGSGSFNHQAKIVRKTLIPTVLWLLFDFLSLKYDVNVPGTLKK
jgi:hypothetical protein